MNLNLSLLSLWHIPRFLFHFYSVTEYCVLWVLIAMLYLCTTRQLCIDFLENLPCFPWFIGIAVHTCLFYNYNFINKKIKQTIPVVIQSYTYLSIHTLTASLHYCQLIEKIQNYFVKTRWQRSHRSRLLNYIYVDCERNWMHDNIRSSIIYSTTLSYDWTWFDIWVHQCCTVQLDHVDTFNRSAYSVNTIILVFVNWFVPSWTIYEIKTTTYYWHSSENWF